MRKALLSVFLLLILGLGGALYLRSPAPSASDAASEATPPRSTQPTLAAIADTSSAPEPIEQPAISASKPAAGTVVAPAQKPASPYARIFIPAGQPVPELFPFQAERDAIFDIVASDTKTKIPAIAAYFTHRDATVREAARQGLVQLGDEKAIPVLKEAAAKAPTEEERNSLLESAEFLALPNFVDIVLPSLANSNPKS